MCHHGTTQSGFPGLRINGWFSRLILTDYNSNRTGCENSMMRCSVWWTQFYITIIWEHFVPTELSLRPEFPVWQFGKADRCKMLGQGAKSDSWLTEALFSSAVSHIVTRYRHDCWGQLPQLFHFCSSWRCYTPTSCHMLKEYTAHPKNKSSVALTSDYNSCGLNFHPQHYLMIRIKL